MTTTSDNVCLLEQKPPVSSTEKWLRHVASIPFIWLPCVPTMIMHLSVAIYQNIAFPLYGIETVRYLDYVSFDREKLGYLSFLDKINCAYCTYANGVYSYVQEVGRRTEFYWCGVKHRNQPGNPAFAYQAKFAKYGDVEDYNRVLTESGRRGA